MIQLRGMTAELEPRQTHATNRTSADNTHWFAHTLLPISVTAQAGAVGTVTAVARMRVCVASFEFYGECGFHVYGGSLRAAAVVITVETTTGAG